MYNVGTIHFTNIHFLKTASKKREIERETERERELNQLQSESITDTEKERDRWEEKYRERT